MTQSLFALLALDPNLAAEFKRQFPVTPLAEPREEAQDDEPGNDTWADVPREVLRDGH